MHEDIMTDNHAFSTSGIYRSIPVGDLEDYIDYIKDLPLNPMPEAFGLHANAQITTAQIATQDLLDAMIKMQPKTSSGKGKTREEIIGDMAKFLQSKTPDVFDLEQVGKKYPTSYEECMNVVLYQECVRYNGLLAEMRDSLIEVQKALRGEVGLSNELEKMSNAIFNNAVPPLWMQENGGKGFLSMKPLASWIHDCNERIDFLMNWYENGAPPTFWISGFFFPQAFLTGTMQNYARKQEIAIDELSYCFKIRDDIKLNDVKKRPEAGCIVYGIYLEGCKWDYDNHNLTDSDPKKLFTEMPLVAFIPEQHKKKQVGIYKCPTYKVLSRLGTLLTTGHSTNFVMDIEVPTDRDPDGWTRAGVACFLALKF
jgi:dynein heavy chain, axonemal